MEGIDRYRISSIEPNLLTDEIIQFTLAESKHFVPHFHIPLQSGSNRVLQTMRRKYLKELYAERVKHIKSLRSDCCIGVDVIIGFPGETDEEFMETVDFIKDIDISYLHVFTYSERMLHILSDKKKRAFYEQNVGTTRIVLFENEEENGMMNGFTENYIKVKTVFDTKLANTFQTVKLTEIDRDGLMKCEIL